MTQHSYFVVCFFFKLMNCKHFKWLWKLVPYHYHTGFSK